MLENGSYLVFACKLFCELSKVQVGVNPEAETP